MADRSPSRQPSAPPNGSEAPSEVAALREELARSEQEVTRLRELLIAKDVELGKVRGRLEQLEQRTDRLLGAAVRLRRFGPAFARLRRALRPGRNPA